MTDLTSSPHPIDFTDPEELLSSIPYEFQFEPAESLVFLATRMNGVVPELLFSARVDIVRLLDLDQGAGIRRSLVERMQELGVEEVHLVLYSVEFSAALHRPIPPAGPGEGVVTRLTMELAWWFDLPWMSPRRTYVVGEDVWSCLSCRDRGHCPGGGRSREDLKFTAVSARMVVSGRAIARSREDLIALPAEPPPSAGDHRVQVEARRLIRERSQRVPGMRSVRWQEDFSRRWNEALRTGGEDIEESDFALLALALHCIQVRDNVIYAMCTSKPVPPPSAGTVHFTSMFTGASAPNPLALDAARFLLSKAAGNCPPLLRAPALSVWAWVAWWAGDGGQANDLLGKALGVDRRYSLARTLAEVLARGSMPPWRR